MVVLTIISYTDEPFENAMAKRRQLLERLYPTRENSDLRLFLVTSLGIVVYMLVLRTHGEAVNRLFFLFSSPS